MPTIGGKLSEPGYRSTQGKLRMSMPPSALGFAVLGPVFELLELAASIVRAVYAAGMPGGLDTGALATAGLAAGVAAGAWSAAPRAGNVGFRYAAGDATIRDRPSDDGDVVSRPPNGLRLVYDCVLRDANGNVTHYHVVPPGMHPGWIPAGETTGSRPVMPPRPRPIRLVDSGEYEPRPTAGQTAGSRG